LKQGGTISGIHLGPLPSNFLDLWKVINEDWNVYKTSVTDEILRKQNQEGNSHPRPVTTKKRIRIDSF
jgi:hypothetical protein